MEQKTEGINKKEDVRAVIRRVSRDHVLNNNGLIVGQNLITDGRVRGTIPEIENERGIVEFPLADVAGGAFAVGAALAGRRPIYVVRFQGFQWFDAIEILNYAAKSKEMWDVPCPLFVRSVGLDAGSGPVAGNSHHGIYYRMPGVAIAEPGTPNEYESVWNYFMSHDDPVYVGENRRLWDVNYEFQDSISNEADVTLFPISSSRLDSLEAKIMLENKYIKCNIININWLKPFLENRKDEEIGYALAHSRFGGLVLDGDYAEGVAKNIAYDLMTRHYPKDSRKVYAMALKDRTAGFAAHLQNLPPSPKEICDKVTDMVIS